MVRWFWLILVVALLALQSCDDKVCCGSNQLLASDSIASGVFIANEGNFQWGNASLSFYSLSNNTLYNDVFKTKNKRALGDVLQSVALFQNKAYLVVNNSQKVEVLDPNTLMSIGTITGFRSPRYFLGINSNKAYVTDLYQNGISVVDLVKGNISKIIPIPGWTEELIMGAGTEAFVTLKNRDKIYVIDTQTDLVTDSIQVGYGPNSLVFDRLSNLWVLCEGNQQKGLAAGLFCIEPMSRTVTRSFPISTSGVPSKLRIDGSKIQLYFLNQGVFTLSAMTDTTVPASPLIQGTGKTFYGLAVNPTTNEIFVSDVKDYVSAATIYRYKSDGSLIGSFVAGTNTGEFAFK